MGFAVGPVLFLSQPHHSSLNRSGPGFLLAPHLALLALRCALLFTQRFALSLCEIHICNCRTRPRSVKAIQRRRTARFVSLRLDAYAESCSNILPLYGHLAIIRPDPKRQTTKPRGCRDLSARLLRALRFPTHDFGKKGARDGRRSGSPDGKRCLRIAPSSPDYALQAG